MATQICHEGFVGIVSEFDQRAVMAEEAKARREEQEEPHMPEYFRRMELHRHQSRMDNDTPRCIDILINFAYINRLPYEPWMVEHMVREHPLALDILLDDIEVFLDFESGEYRNFWQKVKNRVNLTSFYDPRTRTTIQTQYAALQSRPRVESYWPV